MAEYNHFERYAREREVAAAESLAASFREITSVLSRIIPASHSGSSPDASERIIAAVRSVRSNHPVCDRHAGDDTITCGWKNVVLDIDEALASIRRTTPQPDDAGREETR